MFVQCGRRVIESSLTRPAGEWGVGVGVGDGDGEPSQEGAV